MKQRIQFCEYHVTPLPNGRVLLKCKFCTFTREWTHARLSRRCGVQPPTSKPEPRKPCKHQGTLLRLEQCQSCGGRVYVKVFACALHGQCTVRKQIGEMARCGTCEDYTCDISS